MSTKRQTRSVSQQNLTPGSDGTSKNGEAELSEDRLDKVTGGLSNFASANSGNPTVMGAIETSAAETRSK